MKLTLEAIASSVHGRVLQGSPETLLTRISIDTRSLKSGDLFFAIKGPRFDAHDFLDRAVTAGASALVVHRIPAAWKVPGPLGIIQVPDTLLALQELALAWRKKVSTTLIGITGSNGKTTTKEMLTAILMHAGKTLATTGNLNNHIGLPLTLLRLEADHQFGVIEMGTSMPGDMDVLARLTQPQAALITNVGQDHLEFFGTPEGVLRENAKLFRQVSPDGFSVLNEDDPWLIQEGTRLHGRLIRYSVKKKSDVYATEIQPWPWPMRFTLVINGKAYPAELPVIGALQVQNAVAAAAVAYGLGIEATKIVAGLAEFKPAAMRMEVQPHKSGAILVNDAYNANPSSVQQAVESFCASFPKNKRWVVLGDMRELGAIAHQAHHELGVWLTTQPLDRVFLYGRDTRFVYEGLQKSRSSAPDGDMKVERFRKKRYLLEALAKNLNNDTPAILFKASRRMRLETLVQELMH